MWIKQVILLLYLILFSQSGLADIFKTKYSIYPGFYKSGGKYVVNKKTYYPYKKVRIYSEKGLASWYNEASSGIITANGDIFNSRSFTLAHRVLPLPSIVKVKNLSNKKCMIAMVNDRGPFYKNRLVDLSATGAQLLGFKNSGVAKVQVTYMNSESIKLLKKLRLKQQNGSRANGPILDNKRYPLNEYLIYLNKKYGCIKRGRY
jgi:rare lipoprotein A